MFNYAKKTHFPSVKGIKQTQQFVFGNSPFQPSQYSNSFFFLSLFNFSEGFLNKIMYIKEH